MANHMKGCDCTDCVRQRERRNEAIASVLLGVALALFLRLLGS